MAHALNLNAAGHYVEQPSVLARLRQSFADYLKHLATYEELNALSGRQLADMGISRLNIRELARESVSAS